MFRKIGFIFIWCFLAGDLLFASQAKTAAFQDNAPESDQQISDFSLAGYGDKGKKTWDISGRSADIFGDEVKLKDVVGNLYGEAEDIRLTADQGNFDKAQGKVHLEQNVVIKSSSGGRMTTDSLDWDRKNQIVSTKDNVNIEKENMITRAEGATGHPNLNQITLEKDVTVNIAPDPLKGAQTSLKDRVVITCDGPLEIDYGKNLAIFKNNVQVIKEDLHIISDFMDVYFSRQDKAARDIQDSQAQPELMGSRIEKIVARGNVKITRGENISYSDEAIYTAQDKKITLSGKPRLIIYSAEELNNASVGN